MIGLLASNSLRTEINCWGKMKLYAHIVTLGHCKSIRLKCFPRKFVHESLLASKIDPTRSAKSGSAGSIFARINFCVTYIGTIMFRGSMLSSNL